MRLVECRFDGDAFIQDSVRQPHGTDPVGRSAMKQRGGFPVGQQFSNVVEYLVVQTIRVAKRDVDELEIGLLDRGWFIPGNFAVGAQRNDPLDSGRFDFVEIFNDKLAGQKQISASMDIAGLAQFRLNHRPGRVRLFLR